jgi:autoinducer 2-degrading protein
MTVTLVHVYVKPEFIQAFVEATLENHEGSIQEPGNLRFDVIQDAQDQSKFILYEAYADDEAVADHKETDHYKKWKEAVAPWMSRPREGVKYKLLFPTAEHFSE